MPDSVAVKRFVVEKIEFINISITGSFTTKESATFKKISSGCAESVTQKIASCGRDCIKVPDATEILTHLHNSHLLPDDKEKIANAINGKAIEVIDADKNDGPNSTNTQTIPILKYMVQGVWDFIASETDIASRISFLGDFFRGLGVFNPSENTAAEIASLALFGHVIKPTDVVRVRELKAWMKNKGRNAVFIKGPNVYPENPEKLKETHPQIWENMYKDQRPVECPLNPITIKMNMAGMPRRCTRTGANSLPDKRRCITPALSPENDVMSLLANAFQRAKPGDNRVCHALQILGRAGGEERDAGTNHSPGKMLAIEDRARDASVSPTIDMPPKPKPLLQNGKNGVDDMIAQMKSQLSKKTSVTDADETESEDENSSDGKKVGVKSDVKKKPDVKKKKRPASARLARSDIKKTKTTTEKTKKKAGRMEETVRMQGHIDSKLNNRYAPAPVEINSNNLSTLR